MYQEMSTAHAARLESINAKPVMAAIREFFGSSQLSQFRGPDPTLSEITKTRRI